MDATTMFIVRLTAERDEYKRRAELWERLHDDRTAALRNIRVLFERSYREIGDEIVPQIASAADARSCAADDLMRD